MAAMGWLALILAFISIVVLAWLALLGALWLHRPTRDLVRPTARFLPDLARLVRALLADRETPRSAKLALGALLVWILSPIDLVPEFIPVIGPLDDLVVSALVLGWVTRRIGREPIRRHWTGSPEGLAFLERLLRSA